MAAFMGALRGGFFPENWMPPLAMGLGVVITGYLGDTIAGFVSGFIPAEWLNPASEIIIGILLFLVGGWVGGDMSMWLRMFSLGAFAVGIADSVTVLLGLGVPTAAVRVVTARPAAARYATTAQRPYTIPTGATRPQAISQRRYTTNPGGAKSRYQPA